MNEKFRKNRHPPFNSESGKLAGVKSGEKRRAESERFRTALTICKAAETYMKDVSDGVARFWFTMFKVPRDRITAMMNFYTPALIEAYKDRDPARICFIFRAMGYDNPAHAFEIGAAMTEGQDRSRIEVRFVTDAEVDSLPAPEDAHFATEEA